MKNGYYLSTYICINKLGYLENIEIRHDQNLSLWKKHEDKIELIHYWELERITGEKQHNIPFYDVNQARKLLNKLLAEYSLTLDDIEEIWGTPELDNVKDYHSLNDYNEISYHSICHLFSSLLSNTNTFKRNNILSFAVDGAPDNIVDHNIEDKNYYCGSYSINGKILDIFPVYSPGVLWGYARDYLGKREGTLMALATACKAQLKDYKLKKIWVKDRSDVYDTISELQCFFEYVENLSLKDEGLYFLDFDKRFTLEENKISMIMKVIQEYSNKIMERNIQEAVERFNIIPSKTILCLSGGYSLNCPTNSFLMSKYNFSDFLSLPCVNDSGLSLGVALYSFFKKTGNDFQFEFKTPFIGNKDLKLKVFLEKYKNYIHNTTNLDFNQVIYDIKKHPIVWYQNRSEIGPRALGNRSIIADPTNIESKTILNKIKKREWWRPVAPIIMQEFTKEWFNEPFLSPYMLHTFSLRKNLSTKVPSISHLDNTARVQTLKRNENETIYKILSHFQMMENIPILCNTSLNDKGEPIIDTIDEVFNFALRKGFPIIYINHNRITLKNHSQYPINGPLERTNDFKNYLSYNEKKKELKQLNPYNIQGDLLRVYIQNPNIQKSINLSNKQDVKLLEKLMKLQKNIFKII